MRKTILACLLVAIVVATALPAGAVDDGFRGWYRVIGHRRNGSCSDPVTFRDRVQIRYVSERVRRLAHEGKGYNGRLRYMPGADFPWQTTHDSPFTYELRYRRHTDTAVGYKHGVQTTSWCVRLVPIG